MKRITLAICAVASLLFACTNEKKADDAKSETVSTETKTDGTEAKKEVMPVLDSATKMNNMMAYGTPGAMHQMMAKWNGNWTADIKYWPAPDAPASSMQTKTANKMINNGLIQYSTHNGLWEKMPFNGISQTGYDNHRGVFWTTWYDNFTSGLVYLEGSWDEATKSLNFKGNMVDPQTKEVFNVREVMKIVDDNTQVMEQFHIREGKENKAMEITFKRSK